MFVPAIQQIEACRRLRILVVGDVMLDHYLRGTIERTSPEAPVGVLNVESEEYILGGAGNVARNLAAMGASVSLAGLVGDDTNRQVLLGLLSDSGISTRGLVVDKYRPTTLKTRAVAQGQQMLRIDRENKTPLGPSEEKRLLQFIQKEIPKCDGVIVSDYGKGVLTGTVLRSLIDLCHRELKPVVADPKGLEYGRYRGIDILTPNQKEAQAASGIEITDDASLARAAATLNRQIQGKAVCITRGAKGVHVFPQRGKSVLIPAIPREVYDVTGAGDTFVAHLALGYFQGLRIPESASWANLAAGIVVEHLGVTVVTPRDLLGEVHGDRRWTKRCTVKELGTVVRAHQESGHKVVFTNGCFDLLHVGHFRLLESARALGDCLIVALNSDASVRAIKGPPRPLLPEEERIALLAALHFVDHIVVFDEASPENLLRTLKPDILVKGGNLEPGEVVGRDIVEAYGGEVRLLPSYGDRSISHFLERLGAIPSNGPNPGSTKSASPKSKAPRKRKTRRTGKKGTTA